MCLGMWSPGKISGKGSRGTPLHKVLLAGVGIMTTFAVTEEVCKVDSEHATRAAVARFFAAFGMPMMLLIDDGLEFEGALVKTCELLVFECCLVTKGNQGCPL